MEIIEENHVLQSAFSKHPSAANPPTWFSTPERIGKLFEAAELWRGTPFAGNGLSIGLGVSCQKLVGALYQHAGFPCPDPPDGPMAHDYFNRTSLIVPWVEARPNLFTTVDEGDPIAGDLLGFKLRNDIHHAAVALGEGRFFNVVSTGADYRAIGDPMWLARLKKIWRPNPDAEGQDSTL